MSWLCHCLPICLIYCIRGLDLSESKTISLHIPATVCSHMNVAVIEYSWSLFNKHMIQQRK